MTPEEQEQLDLEKAQQANRAQGQRDRVIVAATQLPPDPTIDGGVRGALTLTEDDNAENEKIINRLSVLGGQPKAALRALEPTELQRLAREQGVLFGTENTPTLRQQYTNPDFARSASDDVKALAEIEKQMLAAREAMAPKPKPPARTAPQGNMARQEGAAGAGVYPSGEVVPGGLPGVVDLARSAAAGAVGDTITAGGGILQSGAELADEFFRSPVSPALAYLTDGKVRGELPKDPGAVLPRVAEWAAGAAKTGKEVGDFIAPEVTGDFIRDAINSGARSAGQSLVWVAAAAATRNPEIAIVGLSGVTYGQKYNEYREAGIAPFEAALGAGAQAGLEGLTEALPFHVLVGDITNKTPFGQMLLKQLFAENATEQVATFTQDAVDWAVLNPDKTLGEFLAERPNAALQTAIATTVATMLQTTAAKGADAAAGHFLRGEDEARREAEISNAGREAMKNLMAAASESKTRERDPEQFREYVDKLAQEGSVHAAYFTPEAFTRVAQTMGKTPDELAAVFGVEGQVEAALAAGAKIEVPLGVFLEKVGGMDNAAAILKETAHSPFHLSEVDEAAVPDSVRQRMVADADKVAQAAVADDEFATGVEEVRKNIEEQLNKVARFVTSKKLTGTPNRLYAQLASVFYGNIARQLGITPAEAFAKRPLSVMGERITGQVTQTDTAYPQGVRGVDGAAATYKADGFKILDAAPETTQDGLATDLGITINQAAAIRKAWKESRGIPTNKTKNKPGRYAQDKFEPIADIATEDLLELPEGEWNDTIRKSKYAVYKLPPGVTELELPKGYVVLQSSAGNYAVREDHLKARQKTGERFAKLQQHGRGSGYYVPSESTIILMAKADFSTFIHELGHHFLEMRFDLAKQLKADVDAGRALSAGEQELLDDVRAWFRHAGIKPGNPGEGNALPQDIAWGLYFFDNILIDPTEADLKAFKMKMAHEGKPFTIRLFKTTNGRIVAFPGEYTHDDARMLLAANEKPSAEFKMRHAMWDGGSLKFQSWYDTSGVLDDDGGKFAQDVIASLKQISQLTPEDRAQWYDDEVEEQLKPSLNGTKLALRSDPSLQYPDINIDITTQVNKDGRRGVTADLYFNGRVSRDPDAKATQEDLVKAQAVFARAVVALQAYAERYKPDYIAFTPAASRTDSRAKLYDALLRRYPFGYEARITSTIDIVATESKTTKGVAKRFLLVRPDIARDVPLELTNDQFNDGEWFGEHSVEKRRVHTEIVQSGRSAPRVDAVDTGGPGTGGSDVAGTYAQGRPRAPTQVSDRTIERASQELNETQFEAWKLAIAGKTNEEIAVSMGGEDATVTPADVNSYLRQAAKYGYHAAKQPHGITLSGDTLRVIALSARGLGPTQIAEEVYHDRPRADAINQVKQLRFRHKGLIEQWKAQKEGKLAQGPIFYSALKRAVENAKQSKASAAEWKAILKKTEGVKAEEIEWTGLFDWLDSGSPQGLEGSEDLKAPISRETIVSYLKSNGVKVEEVLHNLAAAEAAIQDRAQELEDDFEASFLASGQFEPPYYVQSFFDDSDGEEAERWYVAWSGMSDRDKEDTFDTEEAAQDAADTANMESERDALDMAKASQNFEREARRYADYPEYEAHVLPGGTNYTELLLTLPDIEGPSTHWQTRNVVAHTRFQERRGPNGERVLAIEEIQSDWHQKGAKQGYKVPFDRARLDEAQAKFDALQRQQLAGHDRVLASQERAARLFAAEPFASILKKIDERKDGVTAIIPLYDNLMGLVNRTPFQATGTFLEQVAGDVFSERMFAKLPQEQQDAARAAVADMEDARDAQDTTNLRAREAEMARNSARSPGGIPEAPFKDTKAWAALVLKRMIRYAAEHGYDQVAWIPGTVKNGDQVPDSKAGSVTLILNDDRGSETVQYTDAETGNTYTTNTDMTPENILGREAAKRLREQPTEKDDFGRDVKRLSEALTIHNQPGWEFYDIIVPSVANKLGKPYGAVVSPPKGGLDDDPKVAVGDHFHTLPITPELKAAALDGMPLFQPEQDGPPSGNPLSPEEKAFFARAMRELPPGSDEIDIWDAMSLAERTPYHELFARQFEAYAFEGKAPSAGLKRMFEQFRVWLKDVYKSIVNLNAPLTDEVRGIMDRMLASEADIAHAHKVNALSAMFATKPEKMNQQEWEDYLRTNEAATQDAESTLSQRTLRDMKWLSNARSREMKRLQAEAREQRKAMVAEVTAEVMAEPVNVARKFLSKGLTKDGKPVDEMLAAFDAEGNLVTGKPKLSIAALKEMFPESSGVDWAKLGYGKWGMLAEEGLHPDAIARMLGYESGDALVRELTTAEPANDKIQGVTDQRMLERYGDLTDEASIARAADEAVYSNMRGKILAAEYAALSAALGEKKLLNEAAKQAASTIVRRLIASKLSVKSFLAAERAAGRAAEDALRKNDLAGAAAAKKDQLLSFYLVKEVMEKQKEYDKTKLKFKQIIEAKKENVSKSRNFDLVQASRAILAAYGMAQMRQKPMDYMNAVRTYDPTLYSALEPTLLNAMTTRQTLAQLNVEQFFGVRDVVLQLWDLSREEKLVEINGQKMELKDVTDELNTHMAALGADPNKPITEAPSPAQRTLRMLEGAAASLRRVESWARLMDKGVVGPFTRFVWRPISQAATRYRKDQTSYILKFRELFAPVEKTLGDARVAAPELGYTFRNKAELLHAILHTGNASNLRKLLLGYRWAQDRADGTLDTTRWDTFLARMAHEGVLTAQDYQFAQSVWDLLEETKPLAQEAHRRVFGRYFSEITADEVHTPFGSFRGGYVPAIYDDFHNTDVALKRGQDAVEGNDSTMFPSPSKGFTEARVEYNRPMQLDVRLLASHLDKVLKFAHMAGPVRDVLRILRSPGVERHLHDLHPTAVEDMLIPWLVRSARQTNEAPIGGKAGRAVTAFANGLRRRSNMGLMFANIVNVLQQPTGLFNASSFKGMKKRYLAQGLARYLRNPAGTHDAVRALSSLMETRSSSQAIAMRDTLDTIVNPKGKFEKAAAWFERHTYFAQTALQNQQDVVVWLGAYESAKSRGDTEAEAAHFADAVIRQTQGSATPEDISRFETGTGWQKILTSMYGYFNMWGNQLSTEFRGAVQEQGLKKGKGRLLYVYFVGFAAPALLAQLIADSIRGDLPDPDEDEGLPEWLSWFFGTQAKTAAAMVPIVGASVIAGVNAFNDKPYDDRVLSSPAVSALETVVRVPNDFADYIGGNGDLSRTTKDTLSLLTLVTGLPFQALSRPLGYAADVLEGDVAPEDGLDYARGLVAGR